MQENYVGVAEGGVMDAAGITQDFVMHIDKVVFSNFSDKFFFLFLFFYCIDFFFTFVFVCTRCLSSGSIWIGKLNTK